MLTACSKTLAREREIDQMREKVAQCHADSGKSFRHQRFTRESGERIRFEIIHSLWCDDKVASRIVAQTEGAMYHFRYSLKFFGGNAGEISRNNLPGLTRVFHVCSKEPSFFRRNNFNDRKSVEHLPAQIFNNAYGCLPPVDIFFGQNALCTVGKKLFNGSEHRRASSHNRNANR